MNDTDLKKLIVGIGAMSELLKIFYDSLKKQGMSEHEALELTKQMLVTLIPPMK